MLDENDRILLLHMAGNIAGGEQAKYAFHHRDMEGIACWAAELAYAVLVAVDEKIEVENKKMSQGMQGGNYV